MEETATIPTELIKVLVTTLEDAINSPVAFNPDYAVMVKSSTLYKNNAMEYVIRKLVEYSGSSKADLS